MHYLLKLMTGIILLFCCMAPVNSSLNYGVMFPLQPSPPEGPYDDQEFLKTAEKIITSLSGEVLPTEGTKILNLMTTQVKLSQMNISPDFYPDASEINDYLYYLFKAGQEFQEVKSLTHSPFSPVSTDSDQFREAEGYYDDALQVWAGIKDLFPDAEPPEMPDMTKTNELTSHTLGRASSGF